MKIPDIFDLYTDYLITSFSYTTATGLSGLVDNAISHDSVTRFLSQQDFTSKVNFSHWFFDHLPKLFRGEILLRKKPSDWVMTDRIIN
jgi:hypothetical protein